MKIKMISFCVLVGIIISGCSKEEQKTDMKSAETSEKTAAVASVKPSAEKVQESLAGASTDISVTPAPELESNLQHYMKLLQNKAELKKEYGLKLEEYKLATGANKKLLESDLKELKRKFKANLMEIKLIKEKAEDELLISIKEKIKVLEDQLTLKEKEYQEVLAGRMQGVKVENRGPWKRELSLEQITYTAKSSISDENKYTIALQKDIVGLKRKIAGYKNLLKLGCPK